MSEPHEFHTKQMKKLHTFLARWQGGHARLWAFQAGHCSLTIRIVREGTPGNLHIVCLEPESICGPVAWENCSFEVIDHVVVGGQEDGYILHDQGAGFEIRAEGVDVFENCQPLY
ncbi:MAG: hypothetical protein ETSY2_42145 [Candidatus Entotheonella gemina]|uniref:Uncharacterized protein n=1 Tax=Candidatus Entotheonella gemina TaxID=1429439 RepID=W4LLI4_9BACT|nr:MAG: hypothetical protein ETSY2_42145 [Candidatus Entotheonella gemina]